MSSQSSFWKTQKLFQYSFTPIILWKQKIQKAILDFLWKRAFSNKSLNRNISK